MEGETVVVTQLPPTILDFTAIYNIEFTNMQTHSEDLLVDTGWAFSDTKGGEIFYSTISKVFNDFDGKIFLAWYPGEGHVLTAESYENAIFQLGQNDKEFIGDDVQEDTLKQLTDSCFTLSNDYYGAIQNIVSLPSDTKDTISGFEDAAQFLSECFNKGAIKDTSKKIDTSLLDVPELENLSKNMGAITTGIDILQYVYDCYDIATRMSDWDQSNIDQIRVLASFEDLSYINDASKRLIQSYENPSRAVTDEIIQSTISLLSKTIYNESPFGKVASIMGTAGSCIGTFNQKYKQTSDAYSQLSDLGFSVKIENLAYQLMEESKLIKTDEAISDESIKSYRDRLMLYLRLNLRNKAQLYNINIQGNQDKNWKKSAEALHLQSEIVNCYQMITELIATEQSDALLVRDLGKNFKGLYSTDKRGRREAISVDILMGEDALFEIQLKEDLTSIYWWIAFQDVWANKFDEKGNWYSLNGSTSKDVNYIEPYEVSESTATKIGTYELKGNTLILHSEEYGTRTLNYQDQSEGDVFGYYTGKIFYEDNYDPGEYGENSPFTMWPYGAEQKEFEENATVEEIYEVVLKNARLLYDFFDGTHDEWIEYYLYDMNCDGTNELILQTGTCEGDFIFRFYTITDGKAEEVGQTEAFHSGLFRCESGGLYRQVVHMGYEEIYQITMSSGKISEKSISQKTLESEDSYTELPGPLRQHTLEEYWATGSLE